MRTMKFRGIAVLGLLLLLVSAPLCAAETWQTLFSTKTPAGQNLRGFGRVETEYTGWQAGKQRAWVVTFRCESPEKAATMTGKFLADLALSPDIQQTALALNGRTVPVVTAPGGSTFIACVEGSVSRILCAESVAALSALVAQKPALVQGAVSSAAYPTFLDRFDRYGWGLYGFDGYGRPWKNDPKNDGPKTPIEDLDWLAKHGFRFEPHLDALHTLGDADGLIRNSETEWQVKYAKEKGLPVSFRVYQAQLTNSSDWPSRRFPEYMDQPADFLMRYLGSYSPWCQVSWFAPDIHKYEAVKTMEMLRRFTDEPHVMGWMHPYGEFTASGWVNFHSDYSPNAQKSWREYLKNNGLDLKAVSHIYERDNRPFGDWAQVPIPEYATFSGLLNQVQSLTGDWWYRMENPLTFAPDDAFWKQTLDERYQGLREKWWQGPVDGTTWTKIHAPGGDDLTRILNKSTWYCSTWFRRSFTLTTDQLATTPIYLYWYPISHDMIHSGDRKQFHQIFINGQLAGEVGTWGGVDVTKFLRAGDNEIALHLLGSLWQGRIFLSTESPRQYPYLGEARNRLWVLWHDWQSDSRIQAGRIVLDGMRQVDPNRPVKFMAPIGLGSERWIKMAYDYGGFAHFTGEGMWYFPWYKRYAYLYGVPGSSETAGPLVDTNGMFSVARRVFLEGLNAHDPVFAAQQYTRNPEVRKWWESHDPLLKQMGRYDMYGPQVILYRGTKMDTGLVPQSQPYPVLGEASRPIQNPWNWDIGRGTLQTIGQSYAYLDDTGVAEGKMNGYNVMFDSGNEIMPDASIDRIYDWVKAGGTFVTLPFTGRNSMTEPDGWHIRKLTGCEIGALRKTGQGTVTIAPKQSVFTALAGKTFPDNGVSMDWQKNNLNYYSVELKPGTDCEVLATYENGVPAIVKHNIGQGAVIALGSVFWRNSSDINGLWWPQPIETDFIQDLLAGAGYPQAPCVTDDRLIWPQPYRSNNGLDLVTVLVSWNEDKDVDTTLRLRTPKKPVSLFSFGGDGITTLPFTWKNGEAIVKIKMPAKEVKVVRATGCLNPFDAVSHWWNYQQRMWHETIKPSIDFTPYTQGKWADQTVDLRMDARLTTTAPADAKWQQPGYDDTNWASCPLSILNFWGAEANKPVWVRKTFTLPTEWQIGSGQIRLTIGAQVGRGYQGQARVTLNGTLIHDFGGDWINVDVTRMLRDGENVLALEFKGNAEIQGVTGEVYLSRRALPAKSISLTGEWQAIDDNGKKAAYTIPGKAFVKFPTYTVTVPKEWDGKYQVKLYIEGARYHITQVRVNGHQVSRHVPYDAPADFDITNILDYGQDNTITITGDWRDKKDPLTINTVRLDLYPAE